jgi:thiol:disulfide interchange protein DsbD
MLDVFQIPQFTLVKSPGSKAKKSWVDIFVVGVISGLIVGPCTAPVLAAILVYVGSKQNVLYGFSLLFTFGYGVGFLLIILGTFAGLLTSLPKSGTWLERIKKLFGWVLIFAAEFFLIKMGGLLV